MAEANRDRAVWASRVEYILACVGTAVGFGNIWRFPYLCYRNGGGAFLLPYLACVLLIGVPLLFLETALGQFSRRGVIGSWDICPLMKGLGISLALYGLLQSIYYNIIMTWVGYYFVASFFPDIPWSHCNHTWNTDRCAMEEEGAFASYGLNTPPTTNITSQMVNGNGTGDTRHQSTDPASEFWSNGVLQLTEGLEAPGHVCLHLLASLAVVWVASYFCTWKGIRWSGKVVYFTATFPYVLMVILLIQAALRPGAGDGVVFYLRPRFEALAEAQVWFEAASQVLFSYAVALGIWQAFGSYCPFNSNCYRNSLVVSTCNSLTSFLSGFVVFTMLGHMAHALQKPVHEVAASGPGLAFVVYPRAVSLLPVPHLWAVLFFFMMLLVGIDSQVGLLEAVMTSLLDSLPQRYRKRELVLAIYCISSFLLGISMITQGGMYAFQVVDYYLFGAFVPQVLCLLQVITVAWLYGVNRFYENISSMIGYRIGVWMKLSWCVLTPLTLLAIMIFQVTSFEPLTYDRTYVYPGWANTLGYVMTFAVLAAVPVYAARVLIRSQGGLLERLRRAVGPTIKQNGESAFKHDMIFTPPGNKSINGETDENNSVPLL